jgi:AcrR family transcriptional regulator
VKRKYELRRRAEKQAETRRRIVEAAVELHATKGPAQTTFTDVARLAGVQRATLYSHFHDVRELGMACSSLYNERNPAPDPELWREFQGEERLRRGLRDLYDFFEHNRAMFSRVIADSEVHEPTRELLALRFGEQLGEARALLAAALPRRKNARAALDLALNFRTWECLSLSGLSSHAAADMMVRALLAQ